MQDDAFITFLQERTHRTFFLTAAPGNSGDLLLQKGLELYLAENGFTLAADARDADIILMHGGGSIDDVWQTGTSHLCTLAAAHPEKVIAVAPSTFHFTNTQFDAVLNEYPNELHLFTRERHSYERLRKLKLRDGVHVYAAHDTAFLLAGTAYLHSLKARYEDGYVLIALRTDRESTLLPFEIVPERGGFLEHAKCWYARRRFERFRKKERITQPYRIEDVSYEDFDTFVTRICNASVIHTDRLHVGILGALLGKEVYLYPTKYDKVQGVYEQTLWRFSNVCKRF